VICTNYLWEKIPKGGALMFRKAISYMAIGGVATIAAQKYLTKNKDVSKVMNKMVKQNEKAMNWLKSKMD